MIRAVDRMQKEPRIGKRAMIVGIVQKLHEASTKNKLTATLERERIAQGLKAAKRESIEWLWKTVIELHSR